MHVFSLHVSSIYLKSFLLYFEYLVQPMYDRDSTYTICLEKDVFESLHVANTDKETYFSSEYTEHND